MLGKINTKKERIEKLDEEVKSLNISVGNIKKRIKELQKETIRINSQRESLATREFCWVAAIIGIMVSCVLFVMIIIANEQINNLQVEVNALQDENNVIKANIKPDDVNTFINAVIPNENEELYDANGSTFYYDPDCKSAITDPIFCSRERALGKDSFGNLVSIYRLTNGDFAYIPLGTSVWFKEM